MKTLLMKLLFCCRDREEELGHSSSFHSKGPSRDSTALKDSSELIVPDQEPIDEPNKEATDTPDFVEQEPEVIESSPVEEAKMQEVSSTNTKKKKPKKGKKQTKDKIKTKEEPVVNDELPGNHQPLPPTAKPRRSILKRR